MVVYVLLAAGAQVNGLPGLTPEHTTLQEAVEEGHEGVVQRPITAGVEGDGTTPGYHDLTAPQEAALRRHEVVVRQLLKAGADVIT